MPTVTTPAPEAVVPESQSTVSFDLSDPAIADALTDCKVGEPEELTITFTPTAVSKDMVSGTISSVSYTDTEETPQEPEESEMPMSGGKKMPKALNIDSGY